VLGTEKICTLFGYCTSLYMHVPSLFETLGSIALLLQQKL